MSKPQVRSDPARYRHKLLFRNEPVDPRHDISRRLDDQHGRGWHTHSRGSTSRHDERVLELYALLPSTQQQEADRNDVTNNGLTGNGAIGNGVIGNGDIRTSDGEVIDMTGDEDGCQKSHHEEGLMYILSGCHTVRSAALELPAVLK